MRNYSREPQLQWLEDFLDAVLVAGWQIVSGLATLICRAFYDER